MTTKYQADVVIAGGGLAGLATAHELLDRGLRVLVLDRAALRDDLLNLFMGDPQRMQLRAQHAVLRGQLLVLGLPSEELFLLDGLGLPQGLGALILAPAQVVPGAGLEEIRLDLRELR